MWCDGEYEPEGDPEEWVHIVADEVEEKRLQKMHVKPEGSAEGIAFLTAHSVYDWRKKMEQQARGGREDQD